MNASVASLWGASAPRFFFALPPLKHTRSFFPAPATRIEIQLNRDKIERKN